MQSKHPTCSAVQDLFPPPPLGGGGEIEPVSDPCSTSIEFTLPAAVMTQICSALWSRSFFLRCITADPSPWGNFTPPTKYECGETLGDLEPVYDPFLITSEFDLPETVTQTCTWHLCRKRPTEKVVILTVNHRGPLTPREGHHWNMIVERPGWDGGHLSLLRLVSDNQKPPHKYVVY